MYIYINYYINNIWGLFDNKFKLLKFKRKGIKVNGILLQKDNCRKAKAKETSNKTQLKWIWLLKNMNITKDIPGLKVSLSCHCSSRIPSVLVYRSELFVWTIEKLSRHFFYVIQFSWRFIAPTATGDSSYCNL